MNMRTSVLAVATMAVLLTASAQVYAIGNRASARHDPNRREPSAVCASSATYEVGSLNSEDGATVCGNHVAYAPHPTMTQQSKR